MSNLQPLKWVDHTTVDYIDHRAQGAGVLYRVCHFADKFRVYWVDSMGGSDGNKEFDSLDELKHWVNTNHYLHKMQPYVKPDSITDIANWFKAAKPEPTNKDKTTQLGCVVEEFAELMKSVGLHSTARELIEVADMLKECAPHYASKFVSRINKIDSLDATSDITVTVQGFNQLMGFDGLGAQREVIRSNNSKMVKGKFEYDENGKIMKPDSYSKPDLTKFVEVTK